MSQEKEQREQEELPRDTWKSILLQWIPSFIGCVVSPAIVVFAILLFIKHWNEIRTLNWTGSGWLVGTVLSGMVFAVFTLRASASTYSDMSRLARRFFPESQTPHDSAHMISANSETNSSQGRNLRKPNWSRISKHCICIVLFTGIMYVLAVAIPKFVSLLHNYQTFPSVSLIVYTLLVSLLIQAAISILFLEYHVWQSTLTTFWKERFIPSIERMPLFPTILIWEVLAIAAFSLLAYLWGGWAIWESLTGAGNDPSEIVKIALTTVGGLGAVGYIVIRYRDSQASKRAEERELSRMVDDKMQAAINQLGAEQASTRIAGVYALAEIADTHHGGQHNGSRPDDDYRQRIVDILCGYLRSDRERPTTDENGKPCKDGNYDKAVESTIIAVIRKHLQKKRSNEQGHQIVAQTLEDDQLWCACSLDLHGAHIHETFDLSGATIQTSMNCDNIQLNCDNVQFHGGAIFDNCIIQHGSFINATITDTWFIDATITDTWFGGATITDTWFSGATITDTWFTGATITDTWFTGATITNARFNYATIKTIMFASIRDQGGITFMGAKFQSKDNDFGPIKLESNGLPEGAKWDIQP